MSATRAERAAEQRLSRAQLRGRWRELAGDRLVAAIPYKIELNERGSIEVSPASPRHGMLQAFVASELRKSRPDGTTITECPVETGALEVWLVREAGSLEIITKNGRAAASSLGIDLALPP